MDITTLLFEKIKQATKSLYDLDFNNVIIEKPDSEDFGDFATNISLLLAKELKLAPMEIAQKLSEELLGYDISKVFSKIEAVRPGFINFKLSKDFLLNNLNEILQGGDGYGSLSIGAGKNIVLEYSEPNPNKPQHIGHARNNFLGSSLAEILAFVGYNVIKVNYINDWGTHICKSMLMYKKYGNSLEPNIKPDHFVGNYYSMYEEEEEKNPELAKELAEMFRKLESMDPETVELWKKITNWVYDGWKSTYANLNADFDVWMYQHHYRESGKEIVQLAVDRGIAQKDETGAIVAHLEEYGLPNKVLLRSDGTSIYSTQDLQLAKDSFDKYRFEKRYYVVDSRQSDYFKQIFTILKLLGFEWADRLCHISYGMVSLPEGKMSSRKGIVVNADDVYKTLLDLEKEEIAGSIRGAEESGISAETTHRVALAAFRYGMLKVDPKQDVVFSYDAVTKFEGNTGPYLLYTYARAVSLLEKSGWGIGVDQIAIEPTDFERIDLHPKEESLMRTLVGFEKSVVTAAQAMSPNILANYIYDTAQKFNSFYGEVPVLDSKTPEIKTMRLLLTKATSQVIKTGLKLLGIEVVDRM